MRRSTIFEIGDIVRIPFPFVERDRIQARPALIVSKAVGPHGFLQWALMITSARRGPWPGDISVGPNHMTFGLPVPCFVRTAKITAFPIEAVEGWLGRLPDEVLRDVRHMLRTHIDLG